MEALEGLFISDADEISRGLHSGKTADPFSIPTEADEEIPFNGHAALTSLISRNMASVSHTLTQRISVTIRNLSDPIDIYKAYNLLSFYYDMFLKLIHHSRANPTQKPKSDSPDQDDTNTILSTLVALQSQTFRHFESTTLETLHATIDDEPNPDLSPPSALPLTLSQFTRIAQTRGPNLDAAEFGKLYDTLVKPMLDSCSALSDDLQESAVDTTDGDGEDDDEGHVATAPQLIYKLNYTSLVRDALSSLIVGTQANAIGAARVPLQHATTQIAALQGMLTDLVTRTFMGTSGVDELGTLLGQKQAKDSATASARKKALLQPTAQSNAASGAASASAPTPPSGFMLETLATRLDTFLSSALMDVQDELSKLIDRNIAAHVVRRAVETFCKAFERVVTALEDVDEAVEREDLAKRMGRGRDVNGTDVGDDEDEDGDEEAPTLREVYPRTLDEVRALLA